MRMPELPTLDDTQRNIVAGLGIGLMLGAIAWTSALSTNASDSLWLRAAVPAGMFAAGALIVLWAWRGDHSRRVVLKQAIREGRVIVDRGREHFDPNVWQQWRNKTFRALSDDVGVPEAHSFSNAMGNAPEGTGLHGMCKAQTAYLEGLHKRRWRRRR